MASRDCWNMLGCSRKELGRKQRALGEHVQEFRRG